MIIKTVGAHPLTDALQLHTLVDALHSYGLDREVYAVPKGGYHELEVPDELRDCVGYALANYLLRLLYEEVLREGREVPAKLVEAIEVSDEAAATGSTPSSELGALLASLKDSVLKHLSKHPVVLDARRMGRSSRSLEDVDTGGPLSKLVGKSLTPAKRVIPALPAIGKFHYVDAKVRSWGAHTFDPACGRFVRAGLKLALTYPIRLARDTYGVGVAVLTPLSKVAASEVWRVQALLRTFRGRWIRRCDWGRAHTVLMLLDAYRVAKSLNEGAAGYLVEATFSQTQQMYAWRSSRDADGIKELALVSSKDPARYTKGVAVTSESVTPVHPALKLAKALESVGGSTDWLVDELIHRYYVVRKGEQTINYSFTKNFIKAALEYDLTALYKALRSLTSLGEVLMISPYQLTCLVKALELLKKGKAITH